MQINYWEEEADPLILNHYTGEATDHATVIGLQANTWYIMDVQVTAMVVWAGLCACWWLGVLATCLCIQRTDLLGVLVTCLCIPGTDLLGVLVTCLCIPGTDLLGVLVTCLCIPGTDLLGVLVTC